MDRELTDCAEDFADFEMSPSRADQMMVVDNGDEGSVMGEVGFEKQVPDEMMVYYEGPVMKVGEDKELGKQGLKKKLLKEGEGSETPEVGDEVEGSLPALVTPPAPPSPVNGA